MNSQNRNLLTAVALSLLILLGFHRFYEVPRQEQLRAIAAQEEAKAGTTDRDAQVAGGTGDAPSAQVSTLSGTTPVEDRAKATSGPARIRISNPRVYGSISRTGLRFDDLTFTDYYTALDHAAHVDLLSPSGTESPYYASFGWVPASADIAVPNDRTVWTDPDNRELTQDHPVTLSWDNGHGLVFQRTIAIDANYMFTVTQTVKNNGTQSVSLFPYASVARQGTPTLSNAGLEGALGMIGGALDAVAYSKLKDNKLSQDEAIRTSNGGWLGFSDKYWLVVAIPDQDETITAEFRHSLSGTTDVYQTDYKAAAKTIEPGQTVTETSHLFAGAKQVHLLTQYRDDLNVPRFDLSVDWGRFRFLTKPFFYGIDYLAKLIGNFGLGILAFTVVIRILIFPLAWKTFREMNRMSDLSPQMAAIKERHGPENKQAMQAEVLELYQREKVNPVSGCLPMILQLPIFLSLFKVLSTTIEMRQQPFYWYVHDLSAQDPTNLFTLFGLVPDWSFQLFGMTLPPHLGFLPLVLGCTLMLLQLNGPKVADPLHQKMMLINPVIFTFFMAHLPVGLVIYYIWSNTISIGQQRFIRWFYKKRFKKEPAQQTLTLPGQKAK